MSSFLWVGWAEEASYCTCLDVHVSLLLFICLMLTHQRKMREKMCSNVKTMKEKQSIYHSYAPWRDRGLLGTCGWGREIPRWLPGAPCFEDFCKAALAESRMPPAVWEVFVEEALTTKSIFPSSLTSRVRMSSRSTAIVLFRSAAWQENKKKRSLLEYSFNS